MLPVRKKKGQFLEIEMKNAAQEVLQNGLSIRKAAKENNVDRTTLPRYLKDFKKNGVQHTIWKKSFVTTQVSRIFMSYLLFLEATAECGNLCLTATLQS